VAPSTGDWLLCLTRRHTTAHRLITMSRDYAHGEPVRWNAIGDSTDPSRAAVVTARGSAPALIPGPRAAGPRIEPTADAAGSGL
jgi:hypothetical protein